MCQATGARSALRALSTPVPFDWILADRMTLSLNRERVWVDTAAFAALLDRVRSTP